MDLLLDTHALLWFIEGDESLSSSARAAIESPRSQVFVSIVSMWEMAIKASIGKLRLEPDYATWIARHVTPPHFLVLPLRREHTAHVAELPYPGPHRDPFDRALIAQAIVERFTLVSRDEHFASYPLRLLW